jgi:hypothetical protein
MLPRRMMGLGTPVWRLMENLRPLNAMMLSCCDYVALEEGEGRFLVDGQESRKRGES